MIRIDAAAVGWKQRRNAAHDLVGVLLHERIPVAALCRREGERLARDDLDIQAAEVLEAVTDDRILRAGYRGGDDGHAGLPGQEDTAGPGFVQVAGLGAGALGR